MPTDPLPLDIAAIRRDLHRYPETGFTEFRTASRVAAALAAAGWEVRFGAEAISPDARLGVPDEPELSNAYDRALRVGAVPEYAAAMKGGLTAVAADLTGTRPGPTVAFRFDIDALPITESANVGNRAVEAGYRSRHDGIMHACGHDGHTAVGVALGRKLAERDFAGTVRLLFQPAEEGGRGAAALVEAGAITGVDLLVCFHLGLGLPTGHLAASAVGLLANTKLRARFTGVAAHAAAAPQDGRHALLAAATAALNVHALTRFSGADTRVNVGMLVSGASSNIIPADAVMLLESRADDQGTNAELERRVRNVLSGAATIHEVAVAVERIGAVPAVSCSLQATEQVMAAAHDLPGLTVLDSHYVGVSDDASALIRAVHSAGGEATYCIVGATLVGAHHTPDFDLDEAALPLAVAVLERIVQRQELASPVKEGAR